MKEDITIDGIDSTDTIINMIERSKHKKQLKIIMIDGVALGGFNVVDGERIWNETGIPVITLTRNKPDMEGIKKALKKHFSDWKKRWEIINNGEIHEINLKYTVYARFFGIEKKDGVDAIKLSIIRGAIPEPIRVAHLIATGIKKGESKGRC